MGKELDQEELKSLLPLRLRYQEGLIGGPEDGLFENVYHSPKNHSNTKELIETQREIAHLAIDTFTFPPFGFAIKTYLDFAWFCPLSFWVQHSR